MSFRLGVGRAHPKLLIINYSLLIRSGVPRLKRLVQPRYTRVRGTRKYIFNLVLFENKNNPYIQDFAVKRGIYAQD